MIGRRMLLTAAATLGFAALGLPAHAESDAASLSANTIVSLDSSDARHYRDILAKLDDEQWADAKSAILKLDERDSMRSYLLAKLYLARHSPRVELFDLLDLLNKAPYLPQADRLGRLATSRGAHILPDKPEIRRLIYMGGAPQRRTLRAIADDPAADEVRGQLTARIVADDPAGAEALLSGAEAGLTAEGRTELRERVAWSYYLTGDNSAARRMAARAVDGGAGKFLAQAWWVKGLSAWRDKDWNTAATAFYNAATNASDEDMRSGGFFWAARATMADRHPERVSGLLRAAAKQADSFYGLLARETLGMPSSTMIEHDPVSAKDWKALKSSPNARDAAILAQLGRTDEADDVLRHEAMLSGKDHYAALLQLASDLSLPATQLWLAQRSPDGEKADTFAHFPTPDWKPANGWQVDKALIYAHALQESRFESDAQSPAGARGVMQVMPATGRLLAKQAGLSYSTTELDDPSYNIALGQLYLKRLAEMPATGGLLPKVVAAYNAGPTPVGRWNTQVQDNGDPLLFIESVPYYETRAYLNAVLRNYWVYQMEDEGASPALKAMAEGLWTRFPDGKKTVAVRIGPSGRVASAD